MGQNIRIHTDRFHQPSRFLKYFKRCIGTGRINLALREDYMNNLRLIQQEIGFER